MQRIKKTGIYLLAKKMSIFSFLVNIKTFIIFAAYC